MFGRTTLILLALAAFLGATQLAAAMPFTDAHDSGPQAASQPAPAPRDPHGPLTGSIAQTNETWVCSGPVDLDSVTVTMTSAITTRRGADAVHLEPGCTGRIGRLVVATSVADAVKVAEGVHDLRVTGGSIQCTAKLPDMHQDGIQVMGGERITFSGLRIDCGRSSDSLINSNLFINQAGKSSRPPTDVLCVSCFLGGAAAHTVNIQSSIRSGVISSTVCTAKYPNLTLTVGPTAVDPVDSDNVLGGC
ncbi:MAG TPA: hypothetical protein VH297_09450 [Gaiellaceae bacterium]